MIVIFGAGSCAGETSVPELVGSCGITKTESCNSTGTFTWGAVTVASPYMISKDESNNGETAVEAVMSRLSIIS